MVTKTNAVEGGLTSSMWLYITNIKSPYT